MAFVETADGTRLYYQDWGAGSPVVFVHGWTVGADGWEYQTAALAGAEFRCVAYDQRGCGRSDRPWEGYEYDTLAGDLAALMEKLDLRGATLVGHSMGCGQIARYLSRYGAGRVAKAALIAPTTPYLMRAADNPGGLEREMVDGMVARLTSDRAKYVADIAPGFFGREAPGCSVSPEMVRWGIGLSLRASSKAAVDLLRVNTVADLRDDLRAFTMPTLIVHGDADETAPLDLTARPTAAAIAHSRLVIYEGAPHGVFLTHTGRLNDDLRAFLRE